MKAAFLEDLIILSAILVFILFIVPVASAATTASVTATVTVQNISVSVADGTVAYGTMSVGTSENTTASALDDSQVATNDGNVTQDFNILGSDSAAWTLAATTGADQYTHEWCTSTCDSSPTWNDLTTGYQTLSTAIAPAGSTTFDLQITTPSSSTSFTQQNVDVTVQAVAN